MTLLISLSVVLSSFGMESATSDSISFTLEDYRWKNRVIILLSDDKKNDDYRQQVDQLYKNSVGVKERDLRIVSVFDKGASNLDGKQITVESAQKIQETYGDEKDSFLFLLIGKDGGIKIRADHAVSVDHIFERIDSMPMRQREMKNKYE
jgi:hypothetical protein